MGMSKNQTGEKDPFKGSVRLTPKMMFGISVPLALAIIMALSGFNAMCCIGVVLVPAFLFILPQTFGVTSIKIRTVMGVIFLVVTVIVGALVVVPFNVGGLEGAPEDTDNIKNVTYDIAGNTLTIAADLVNVNEPVVFRYNEIWALSYDNIYTNETMTVTLTVSGNHATGTVTIDRDKLYMGSIFTQVLNDKGELEDHKTSNTVFTEAFDSSILGMSLVGSFIASIMMTVLFFMILIFSTFMRKRMEAMRGKMEAEGRLYPQGYGRCGSCDSVVLPGEINCRKCGAYIDRPGEMKPNKKDFFECSDCGAEVPADARSCPKCGSMFDEDEAEVIHADGSVEITNEVFECSDCGAEVPITASMCPKCGAKFED